MLLSFLNKIYLVKSFYTSIFAYICCIESIYIGKE
nr:MAG TPA: hypothetical protein [Caudoviricetes sp.]